MIMGVGVVTGALLPNRRDFSLVCAFVVATAALVIFGGRLMAPFGNPTGLQLWFLFGSIGLEIVLFRFGLARYRKAGGALGAISQSVYSRSTLFAHGRGIWSNVFDARACPLSLLRCRALA
jgi:hypothetical protein